VSVGPRGPMCSVLSAAEDTSRPSSSGRFALVSPAPPSRGASATVLAVPPPPFSHLNSYSWFVVPADSIAGRIRSLFYIALGNFIFPSTSSSFILRPTGCLISAPVIFNIVLLVIVWDDRINKINVIYVTPINLYVTIFGVVFATGTSSYASTTCPQLTFRSMELILRSHAQRWNSSARARDPATAAAAFCSH
jgi:hypothetical protein